jgi:hypothetical protein
LFFYDFIINYLKVHIPIYLLKKSFEELHIRIVGIVAAVAMMSAGLFLAFT